MTVTMIDCTSVNVPAVLRQFGSGQPVAGYNTGPPDIQWSRAQLAEFLQKIRIAQSVDLAEDELSEARCLDVERFAPTPEDWPLWYQTRANKEAATCYCSLSSVQSVVDACTAADVPPPSRWWLAWWPSFPVRLTVERLLAELTKYAAYPMPAEDVWAWQHADYGLWDVSILFGTPDFSRR